MSPPAGACVSVGVSIVADDGTGLVRMEGKMSPLTQIERVDDTVDIEEAARIRLQLSPYRAIRRCSCSFRDGELRLFGQVPTYHYKQLAQVALVGLAGVRAVVNNINV